MKRYLVLEDNTVFEGEGFGAECEGDVSIGELVFTTSPVGYIETLTDASYYGQIVLQTFSLIGNYGVIEHDFEGKCRLKGYVVKQWCDTPSNFRCDYDIDRFLKESGVPGICGVDTRELTRIIRENGAMNAILCDKLPATLDRVKSYSVNGAVKAVSPDKIERFLPEGEKTYTVVLLNFGARNSLIRSLCEHGCEVISVPADTDAQTILGFNPDGVVLSGGPGNPNDNRAAIDEISKLFSKVAIFATGLGHQLLALSQSGKTIKLSHGHRGANQPVRDLVSNRIFMATQNHGYTVEKGSVKNAELSFINVNDGTCEGLCYPNGRAFSVEFEAVGQETQPLFERFTAMMKEGK